MLSYKNWLINYKISKLRSLYDRVLHVGVLDFLFEKKDWFMRMCIDYSDLNPVMVKNKYMLLMIDDLFNQLQGASVFSKIGLRLSYHQVWVKVEDISKTAFWSHYGHYEFLVMTFGLSNASVVFRDFMNWVFRAVLNKYVILFIDDILVYSQNLTDHSVHLAHILKTLWQNKVCAKFSKCKLWLDNVAFLRHTVYGEGISADPCNIEAILGWKWPSTV